MSFNHQANRKKVATEMGRRKNIQNNEDRKK